MVKTILSWKRYSLYIPGKGIHQKLRVLIRGGGARDFWILFACSWIGLRLFYKINDVYGVQCSYEC